MINLIIIWDTPIHRRDSPAQKRVISQVQWYTHEICGEQRGFTRYLRQNRMHVPAILSDLEMGNLYDGTKTRFQI